MATTQKVTGTLRKAGFKAYEWVSRKDETGRYEELVGDYRVYKWNKNVCTLEVEEELTEKALTELVKNGMSVFQMIGKDNGIYMVS